ncbi:hypothetical protein B9Z55_012630 [Caenorhabditis nigoni]|uniref:Uncharacterized protein n=1 Tax=Caenorhabditis nigoni TaxID=1611254 RepID=A0A2G5TY25_9PELO|nr:hypothetical protein B9Z55_012630 [Caenorhabditis nigoni]
MMSRKIDRLVFEKDQVTVNNTAYQVRIHREYPPGHPIPSCHREDNEEGGFWEDDGIAGTTPGDVALFPAMANDLRQQEHQWEGLIAEYGTDADVLLRSQANLADIDHKLYNTELPYSQLAQITIHSTNGKRSYRSSGTLPQGLRYLNTILFGTQALVNEFQVNAGVKVLRLPVGLKFHIKNLAIGMQEFPRINPIVDGFPDQVRFLNNYTWNPQAIIDNEITLNAKKLVIVNLKNWRSWSGVMKNVKNTKVDLLCERKCFSEINFERFVKDWVENGRPVGTDYRMEFLWRDIAKKCFEAVRSSSMEMLRSTDDTIIIPIYHNASFLKLQFMEISREIEEEDNKRYVLQMTVHAGPQ